MEGFLGNSVGNFQDSALGLYADQRAFGVGVGLRFQVGFWASLPVGRYVNTEPMLAAGGSQHCRCSGPSKKGASCLFDTGLFYHYICHYQFH